MSKSSVSPNDNSFHRIAILAVVAIKLGWIAATVCLIINEHQYWAIVTFICALCVGYSVQSKG
ncbi:hypothetical protein VII00023_20712 [Vibrio ichthyoenteri ATCC 700023]|uniref:Uncharacterized protein n=1 Tax=Vibrio ichthyoenteri ATCC 700023 TaxID=870968 RepID=F9S7V5_9VIBR|nr:hypothetical protein [Vibrio ichthyoenteri]EGU31005.1 hypothetical protein VII00023_20712 [Vibrio ichthyoenteri ATCC 700023]